MIIQGLEVMAALGHRPEGFTAPGWLLSGEARQALAETGFSYTTTHLGVVDLQSDQMLRAVRDLPIRLALHPEDLDDPYLRDSKQALIQSMGLSPTSTYAQRMKSFSQDTAGVR